MSDELPKEDDRCGHPMSKISRIDGDGLIHMKDALYVWGECECGSPTIIKATIEEVELDAKGSVQSLREMAELEESDNGE